ncbi:unnamed protein product [Lactuca saligna]|uniref:Disease resistance R13L4/SHOC-2-like LRR domain-containing protein n=1 Tax=Lactuca saligna TaxID=75948 RepID=A0AA35Y7Q5_LACSI|nr:unnamed protein product [Lactuca saligna]
MPCNVNLNFIVSACSTVQLQFQSFDVGYADESHDHDQYYVHVIGIDLSERSLCGRINSSSTLFNLVHLQRLNLSGNNFGDSQIPSEIARLKQLRSLDLSDSGFSGQIPNGISQLIQLSSLDLSRNSLKLHNPSLKKLVQNLTGLEELHLSGVDISSSDHNSLLEKVILPLTRFFGIIPESISHLKQLKILSLSECSFSGRIPGSLSNLSQLTFLGLGENHFTGSVPSFGSLLKLDVLELTGNKFEKGRFPNWLGRLTTLRELYLTDMNVKGEIPLFLANLTKLSVIGMKNNSLIRRIPSWLFNLTQLTSLNLDTNQMEGPIPNTFSIFKNLEYLNLGGNNFNGRVELDMFLGLNKLQTLWLGHNKISLVATNNYTITTLPELDTLGLSACNLKEFPSFLRFQNKLHGLLLNDNKIDGRVPVWIWNNSRETLEFFDLSHNSITGQLPIPPQTTVLYDISHNNLTGEIPSSICGLKSLRMLDLSSNNMSGTLPSCLDLDLSFTGQLPRSLTNCTNLEVLSLGDNSFHDVFPSWMGTLAKIQVLVLRSNKLYGPIQGSSHFPKLRIIDLSNNNFSGQLHQNYFQTWSAMSSNNLGVSSVMRSEISTKTTYSNFPYTATLIHKGVRTEYEHILTIDMSIDLSCNNFEGEIPASLQALQGLQALNLSNNHFTGRVLPSLGNLKNLEALDLSRNELSGEIPQRLVQLGFLEIFNVSFNRLEGRIPKGKQFGTFDNNSYIGNHRLCGQPLSKECQGHLKVYGLPPTSNVSESLLPSEAIDWIIVFCGVGSGLVVGIVIGNFLHAKYSDRFTKKNERWVSPLRNTRRN